MASSFFGPAPAKLKGPLTSEQLIFSSPRYRYRRQRLYTCAHGPKFVASCWTSTQNSTPAGDIGLHFPEGQKKASDPSTRRCSGKQSHINQCGVQFGNCPLPPPASGLSRKGHERRYTHSISTRGAMAKLSAETAPLTHCFVR
jgi:hypothetical protein